MGAFGFTNGSCGESYNQVEDNEDWQIRIAIPAENISKAVELLQARLKRARFEWKHINISEMSEFHAEASGIISSSDRDQKWKTICIYLPSVQAMQPHMNPKQYGQYIKTLLLDCWKILQNANITPVYNESLGDKGITVDQFIPTPFSITAFKPYDSPEGILHQKAYNPQGYQDILALFAVTRGDFLSAGIKLDVNAIFEVEQAIYTKDIEEGKSFIAEKVSQLNQLPRLADLLNGGGRIVVDCLTDLNGCSVDNYQSVYEALESKLSPILDRYPKSYYHAAASDLEHIHQLRRYLLDFRKFIKNNEVKRGGNFQAQFDELMTDLKAAFAPSAQVMQLLDTLKKNLSEAIQGQKNLFPCDLTGVSDVDVSELWQKNPAAMQKLHFSLYHYQYEVSALERSKAQQAKAEIILPIYTKIDQRIKALKRWNLPSLKSSVKSGI